MLYFSVLCSIGFIVAAWMTSYLISLAQPFGMLDRPNSRSAHQKSTPTGGGLSFAGVYTVLFSLLYFQNPIDINLANALLFGGPIIAFLGWMDDRYHLSSKLRLAIQMVFVFVVCGVLTDGYSLSLEISFLPQNPWIQYGFGVLFIAWFINLYNFMDGADGIAGSGAFVNGLLLAVLSVSHGQMEMTATYGLLAAVVAGFLIFNWMPAKIFMGDTGAYFLGFFFATMALGSHLNGNVSLYAHVILFAPFICDTTYTLVLRAFRKENIFKAHRQQAIHKLVDKGWSHAKLSTVFNLMTLVWLFPWAIAVDQAKSQHWLYLFAAYTPILAFEVYCKAGLKEDREAILIPFPKSLKSNKQTINKLGS